MGDEKPFKTLQGNFTNKPSQLSSHLTSPHLAAYATERARMLFGCYRRGDANDPEIYVRAIAAVLARYDADMIREVTDPNTGIQTTEKYMTFMPNAGELKIYCDGVAARRERMRRYGKTARADFTRLVGPGPQPGDLANVFVPHDHARYGQLCKWAETADQRLWKFGKSNDNRDGIWVNHHTWVG